MSFFKILFMLFSHKLSSSSTMVPFQTFLTSNPINKIILLTSTHTTHIVINFSNVYFKVLNTIGRCQIALSLVLSLSTCFFAFIFVILFSSVPFLFIFLSRLLSLLFLFFFFVRFFFSSSSSVLPLFSSLFVGMALTKFREETAEVVTFIHAVHVEGYMMVLVRG